MAVKDKFGPKIDAGGQRHAGRLDGAECRMMRRKIPDEVS
jgi:hypothetical protein